MKTNKKRTLKLVKSGGFNVAVTVLIAITIAFTLYIKLSRDSMFNEIDAIENRIEVLEERYDLIKREKSDRLLNTMDVVSIGSSATEVLFTNYGTWDSHSTDTTASMLTTRDFEINDDGMYTYKGLVVLASANTKRLNKPINRDYRSHGLYDTVNFLLNDQEYQGIVLDVCGACYGVLGEDIQRYDIFTTTNVIGKKVGFIFE